jgi:hypothetical protein
MLCAPVKGEALHVCVWMTACPGMYRNLYLYTDVANEGGKNV